MLIFELVAEMNNLEVLNNYLSYLRKQNEMALPCNNRDLSKS